MFGSFVQAVKASFSESVGAMVFGMEDGTVSIFGLVFGVAASASNSSRGQQIRREHPQRLGPARTTSVTVTGLLLVVLGIGRAKVARTNLLLTIFETVGIATAAAVAGLLIGKLVTR